MNYLTDRLRSGNLIYVSDDGYDGCHLGVYLGEDPNNRRGFAIVKWLDGVGDFCRIFTEDINKRFIQVGIAHLQEIDSIEEMKTYKEEGQLVAVVGSHLAILDTKNGNRSRSTARKNKKGN
jgi:hypothetical protein